MAHVSLLILYFNMTCKNRVRVGFLSALLIPEVKELFPALVLFFNMLKNLSVVETHLMCQDSKEVHAIMIYLLCLD